VIPKYENRLNNNDQLLQRYAGQADIIPLAQRFNPSSKR
jgi:hypothetical protein